MRLRSRLRAARTCRRSTSVDSYKVRARADCRSAYLVRRSVQFRQQLTRARRGLLILGLVTGRGLHLENRFGLRARVGGPLHFVVGFRELESKERVILPDLQAALKLFDGALTVAAHHVRQL